ncbi:MAG: ADP-glyceromanno-heptose 6-epimerase [Sedimentisphaerales bacterium]|nr:ADP-glyceromanno-heptose 6-epimerase [Sedimentisphaerales bacterium]
MAAIVVTGGAGFIGSAIVWALNQQGRTDIIVTDDLWHDSETQRWKNLARLQFLDYVNKDLFLERLEGGYYAGKIEGIIHMGACSSTTESNSGFLMENNYLDTQRLALWCCAHKARFVYASSAATYGDGEKGFSDDHQHLNEYIPLNAYAFSKWQFDLFALRSGILDAIAGLKFFNVFGPDEYHKQDMRSVVEKSYHQIKESGKVKLFKSHKDGFEDGGQLRDFVYVKYAIGAVLAVYFNRSANGIFNVGTGKARSFKDLALAVYAALGIEPQIEYIDMPEHLRGKYQYFTQAQTEKLHNIYPDKQWTSLEESVKDYVCNYLAQDDPYLR